MKNFLNQTNRYIDLLGYFSLAILIIFLTGLALLFRFWGRVNPPEGHVVIPDNKTQQQEK
jgi:hypothetical protein